jgi:hypothetical protein
MIKKNNNKPDNYNRLKKNYLIVSVILIIFSLTAVFGLSLITGNKDQTNVGNSLASATEPADINNDNKVDVFDLSILLSKWNTNDSLSDLNKDGSVNVFDLSILLSKWGVVSKARPLLIKHGLDIPYPNFVKSNIANMEKMPFNGLTITLGSNSSKVQTQNAISYDTFNTALAPIAQTTFTKLKHNFVMIYSAPAGDLYGDWTIPISNFANIAKAAKGAGLEGIFYDIEEYFGSSLRYPENCVGRTVLECQNQAQLRGKQIMDAIRSTWPEARVIVSFGPWVSESATANNIPGVPYNDVSWANQLPGPFVVGMVESTVGTNAKVLDGGEIYTARTKTQFSTIKSWQKDGMPAKSNLIPASLKPQWPTLISSSFGIYDQPWQGVSMDSLIWQNTITNALATADDYVWAYTERYDWWGTGWPTTPVPTEWINATANALGQ